MAAYPSRPTAELAQSFMPILASREVMVPVRIIIGPEISVAAAEQMATLPVVPGSSCNISTDIRARAGSLSLFEIQKVVGDAKARVS